MASAAIERLSRWEKLAVAGFFLFLALFGGLVEYRSALLTRRMGDLDVFLRAAWAVQNDADLYTIASDNGWHYIYPPLYAILLVPLADPPPVANTGWYLAYPISVAICYLLNVLCLLGGVHLLASAMEERADDPGLRTQPRFCRRWWLLRLIPVVVCFLPIGHTMMRGQVNVIVLAILCAALAGWIRGQNFRAGAWLAFAICIKVIPVFLLVYPLWKRDGRALAGCAVGLLLGLGVIPLLAFGPAKTATHYETYAKVFFGPFFKLTDDDSRKEEILGANATDSISVKDAIHNWMYTDPSTKRPEDLHPVGKAIYLLLGVTMTFLTLWPGRDSTTRTAHQFAALILLMTIFSPVCHSHYLLFCLPIVMSLLAHGWAYQTTTRIPWTLTTSFAIFVVTMAVAYLPGLEILKDRCAALFATLPLWVIPMAQLWRGRGDQAAATTLESRRAA